MGLWPVENVKGLMSSRPPLVVFMVCLGAFAVVLLSLSYYVKTHDLTNPDIKQDWNVFLQNFAQLEFCITGNDTDFGLTTVRSPTSKPTVRATTRPTTSAESATTSISPLIDTEGSRNYSVSMLLKIQPTRMFLSIPHNVTHVAATIHGHEIGLTGMAADEAINVTAELPYDWNSTHCSQTLGCSEINILTCVHFQAASIVFPSTNPPICENMNETGVEYHARMQAYRPTFVFTPKPSFYYCQSRPVIKIHYKFNPTLTVWLTLHDRSVINLHLMHTSYFLFVMVVTLFCYAVIRGRPYKSKLSRNDHSEYQPVYTQINDA